MNIKIMHLGIAVWPSWEIAHKKMWIWLKSIERFNYQFEYYGVGTKQWPGYRKQKVEFQLDWLLKHGTKGATHIHYTDCCDCLMLGPPEEFRQKYISMGAPPMLVQGAAQLGNASDNRWPYFDEARPHDKFRYPCVGGYIMEVKPLVEFLKKIVRDYPDPPWGDDCFVWYEGFQQGWFRPEIDTKCELWQVCGDPQIMIVDGTRRLYNIDTGSLPCLWHNSGGSANQDTFKDHMMLPMAKELGIV